MTALASASNVRLVFAATGSLACRTTASLAGLARVIHKTVTISAVRGVSNLVFNVGRLVDKPAAVRQRAKALSLILSKSVEIVVQMDFGSSVELQVKVTGTKRSLHNESMMFTHDDIMNANYFKWEGNHYWEIAGHFMKLQKVIRK